MAHVMFGPYFGVGGLTVMQLLLAVLGGISVTMAQTVAEECPPYRLDVAGIGLEQIPAREQGDSGLCYAFSAAVLTDVYRASHGEVELKSLTSPLWLGFRTVATLREGRYSSFDAGWVEQALEVASREGTCRAAWFTDRVSNQDAGQLIARFREFYRKGDAAAAAAWLTELGVPTPPSRAYVEERMRNPRRDLFGAEILSSLCQPEKSVEIPAAVTVEKMYRQGVPTFPERLNEQFYFGRPVAVQFCADMVRDPGFAPDYTGVCSRHYAVAVGQRRQAGKCQILLRDSICADYEQHRGEPVCRGGQHWVDRTQLVSNSFTLTWLE